MRRRPALGWRGDRLLAVTGAIVLALAGGFAAAAEDESEAADALALEALRNYATCAVERTPAGAEKMLSYEPSSPQFRASRRRFAAGHSECAKRGDRLQFGGMIFAGDVAEALIAKKYPATALAQAASKPSPQPLTLIEAVGMCVARAKPAEVLAIFATIPASDAEVAALKPTGDILPGCIPAGQTIKLNRPAVRAIYALGAYRLLAGNPALPEG